MKNKSFILIEMYDLLLQGKPIKKQYFIDKYEVSNRTFRRYISELQAYLFNFYKGYVIVFTRKNMEYILKKG